MGFRGLAEPRVGAGGPGWVFDPPPGWPAPPPGGQPPTHWQPDPSWPPAPSGWEFWKPAPEGGPPGDSFSGPASEIHVTCDGQPYAFQPWQPLRIARATGNAAVVGN